MDAQDIIALLLAVIAAGFTLRFIGRTVTGRTQCGTCNQAKGCDGAQCPSAPPTQNLKR